MKTSKSRPKIIVILGPTSSGKSEVAIRLAKKFDGEIISADSRQIYRGMDIGTGKIACDFSAPKSKCKNKKLMPYWSGGVAHYLIDIINTAADYNVTNFKKDAKKIIENILSRGKLPIICGGTGFWIKAAVDNVVFPEVKPDKVLRNSLRNKTADELFASLKKMDPERANNIDAKNKVRLIRAIEICKAIGKVPEMNYESRIMNYDFLQIGIDIPKEKLHENIKKRLQKRFAAGMIKEVENIRKKYKLSWKKIQSFGLGYFWIPEYLQEEKTCPVKSRSEARYRQDELFNRVYFAEKDYAKRQMTWFHKDKRIKWIKNYKEIEKEVKKFQLPR